VQLSFDTYLVKPNAALLGCGDRYRVDIMHVCVEIAASLLVSPTSLSVEKTGKT